MHLSTHAQVQVHRPHVSLRLLVLVVLVVAVAALGAWALTQRGEGHSQDEVLVDEVFVALNARDGDVIRRLFTTDAVVAFGPDSPANIVGLAQLEAAAKAGVSPVTKVGDSTTLVDPPTGFTVPDASVDQHYVVQPVLIHHDPFVVLFDVRGGKVATYMLFEPFEPIRF